MDQIPFAKVVYLAPETMDAFDVSISCSSFSEEKE